MFTQGGILLIAGLLILIIAGGFLLSQPLIQRWKYRSDDDSPTQIAVDTEARDASAFLVAMEASIRLPQQISLYAGKEVRLGRDRRSNTVTLNDISISRRHARIIGDEQGFVILDEGSRGGTFVDRRRLHKDERHRLQHNEIIQFYTFTYQFVMADAPTQVIDGEMTIPTRLEIDPIQ